jgi:hypothetical protein
LLLISKLVVLADVDGLDNTHGGFFVVMLVGFAVGIARGLGRSDGEDGPEPECHFVHGVFGIGGLFIEVTLEGGSQVIERIGVVIEQAGIGVLGDGPFARSIGGGELVLRIIWRVHDGARHGGGNEGREAIEWLMIVTYGWSPRL